MKLLLKSQEMKLWANSKASAANTIGDIDYFPVVKFFNPCGAGTWLISEMDKDGLMFGLCDLGNGCPELGYVSFDELESIQLPFGLKIERDMYWEADKYLSEYASAARAAGGIV